MLPSDEPIKQGVHTSDCIRHEKRSSAQAHKRKRNKRTKAQGTAVTANLKGAARCLHRMITTFSAIRPEADIFPSQSARGSPTSPRTVSHLISCSPDSVFTQRLLSHRHSSHRHSSHRLLSHRLSAIVSRCTSCSYGSVSSHCGTRSLPHAQGFSLMAGVLRALFPWPIAQRKSAKRRWKKDRGRRSWDCSFLPNGRFSLSYRPWKKGSKNTCHQREAVCIHSNGISPNSVSGESIHI